MFEVSFPGLGIEPFEINSTAFTILGHPVAWYGIIISVAMVLAFFYSLTRAKFEGVKSDDIIDLAIFLVIFGVIGARLYYVIFEFDNYLVTGGTVLQNIKDTFLSVIAIWEGGLAIFGALIAGTITTVFVAKKKKIYLPVLLDILAPSVILAQGIGRWGNFMNGEAYGSETDILWRMGINQFSGGGQFSNYFEVHPTFLYESLWCILGFILLTVIYKKKRFNGEIFYLYMIWYGVERMFVEGLRSDSLYLLNTPIRISQVLAGAVCLTGIVLMIIGFCKNKNKVIIDGDNN